MDFNFPAWQRLGEGSPSHQLVPTRALRNPLASRTRNQYTPLSQNNVYAITSHPLHPLLQEISVFEEQLALIDTEARCRPVSVSHTHSITQMLEEAAKGAKHISSHILQLYDEMGEDADLIRVELGYKVSLQKLHELIRFCMSLSPQIPASDHHPPSLKAKYSAYGTSYGSTIEDSAPPVSYQSSTVVSEVIATHVVESSHSQNPQHIASPMNLILK
jgi:hypothetical protein